VKPLYGGGAPKPPTALILTGKGVSKYLSS
jgi:hypothetical protein